MHNNVWHNWRGWKHALRDLAGTQLLDCVYKMTHSNRFNWSPPGPLNRNTYKNSNFIRVRTLHKVKLSNYDQYTLKGRTLLVFKACQPPSTFVLCNFIMLVIIAIIFITIIIIMTWTREWEWFYLQMSCYYDDEVIKDKSSPSWTWRSTINHNYYMLSQTKTSQLLSNVWSCVVWD